jgi:hypothetical protein
MTFRNLPLAWFVLLASIVPLESGARAQHLDSESISATDAFMPPPIESYREIIDRPLFAQNRRPSVPPIATATAASLHLLGVILTPEGRYAMIADGSSPPHSVPMGAHIAAGVIERITSQGIVLRTSGDQTVRLSVFETATERASATAVLSPYALSDSPTASHSTRPNFSKTLLTARGANTPSGDSAGLMIDSGDER